MEKGFSAFWGHFEHFGKKGGIYPIILATYVMLKSFVLAALMPITRLFQNDQSLQDTPNQNGESLQDNPNPKKEVL